MLQCLIISQDPYRSRRACFYTNHHCFIGQEAMAALSELLETFAQTVGNECRHPKMQGEETNPGLYELSGKS